MPNPIPTLRELAKQATKGQRTARQQFANRWLIEVPRDGLVPLTLAAVHTTQLEVGFGDGKDTEANAQLIARCSPGTLLKAYNALERSTHALETGNERAQRRFLCGEALKALDGLSSAQTNRGQT